MSLTNVIGCLSLQGGAMACAIGLQIFECYEFGS